MTDPITVTTVGPASPDPAPKHLSPTITLVRSLSRAARHSRVALAELRAIATGQTMRRDLRQVLAHQHVLLANKKDAEKLYGFSIHNTYRRIAKAPQGSRARTIRRLAAREVARCERMTQTEARRRELLGQLLVQTTDEPPITLTPEVAAQQTEILCKLGMMPSPKRPLTKPPITAVSGMVYDSTAKRWVKEKAEVRRPSLWSERDQLAYPETRAALSNLAGLREPATMPNTARIDVVHPSSSR